MMYEALVVDNREFLQTGKIQVFIPTFAFKHVRELNASVDKTLITNETSKQYFSADVFNPIAAEANYGMLHIPQVNTRGVVAFLGKGFDKPVWMGSIYHVHNNSFIGPNDDPMSEDTTTVNGESKLSSSNPLIIKMKSSDVGDYNDPNIDTMDFRNRHTENIIIITEKEIIVQHNDAFDDDNVLTKYSRITLGSEDEDGKSVVEVRMVNEENESFIILGEESLLIEYNNDEKEVTTGIVLNDDGLETTVVNGQNDSQTYFTQTTDEILFGAGETNITVNEDELILHSEKAIYIASDTEVRLGDSDGYILTAMIPGTFAINEGLSFTASKRMRG